ncbi:MAG: KTSC domain-containing protein [Bacteroidota bacterium]
MKKIVFSLLFVLTGALSYSQTCRKLPATFNSYSEAIQKVKAATFQIKESANTESSSWIESASYYSCDGETGYMIYSTNKGYQYIHADMPLSVWRGFKNAISKGSYYNQHIKGRYQLYL